MLEENVAVLGKENASQRKIDGARDIAGDRLRIKGMKEAVTENTRGD